MSAGAALGAVREMERMLRELDRQFHRRPRHGRVPGTIGPPQGFVLYADPLDRFEFKYPSRWTICKGEGVHVFSPKLGTFARVDLTGSTIDPWKKAGLEAAALGGSLSLEKVEPGSPEVATGRLVLGSWTFDWSGMAFTVRSEKIVLSLGNGVDARRPAAIERYEDKVLAAIRRTFKLRPGLRVPPAQ